MKRLRDGMHNSCLDECNKECQTPLWKVNINGKSLQKVNPRYSPEKESSIPESESLPSRPFETLH